MPVTFSLTTYQFCRSISTKSVPNLAAIANKRIEQEGWNNIHVVVGPAQTVALPGTFDGLLLFAAHEVLTSPEALDHLLAHLKKEGRIVAFGAKLSNSRRGRLGNLLIRLLTQTLLPASSAPADARPWRFLEDRTGKLGTSHDHNSVGGSHEI